MPTALTVLLPAFDVEAAMGTVVRDLAVASYALQARDVDLDVLLLTDDNPGTADAAAKAAAGFDLELRVVSGLPGPAEAFVHGLDLALASGADLVASMDANGRHDAGEIPHLVDQLLESGCDVVIGSRWARGSGTPGLSLSRWALGRMANLTFRVVTGIRGLRDATTSFRVLRADVLRDLDLPSLPPTTHAVQTALVAHAVSSGRRVVDAPIIYREALAGGPGLDGHDVGRFAAHLVRLRRQTTAVRERRLAPRSRAFTTESFGAADDVERLGTATHFFDWVLTQFAGRLHGRLLEVGAGVGTITRRLVETCPDVSVVALEPARNMFGDLAAFTRHVPRVEAHRSTLAEYVERDGEREFDAVLYLNVLEHIEDDEAELRLAAAALRPGGSLLVFVPALEQLYSELDLKAGHYRRYGLGELRDRVSGVGLDVVKAGYFDPLGVIPYYLVYRLLRHETISGSTLWGYDRLVVPVSRALQRVVGDPPFGKNVVLVAVKP